MLEPEDYSTAEGARGTLIRGAFVGRADVLCVLQTAPGGPHPDTVRDDLGFGAAVCITGTGVPAQLR